MVGSRAVGRMPGSHHFPTTTTSWAGLGLRNTSSASILAPMPGSGETVVGAINMAAHTWMVSLRLLVEMDGPQLVETADIISARLSEARDGQLSNGNGRHE